MRVRAFSASVRRQRGFALIAALFLIVVLAALGSFAVRISGSQGTAADLELASARAQFAAHAGVEYAAARLAAASDCNAVTPNPPALAQGYILTIACAPQGSYTVNGATVRTYIVTVRAVTPAPYGSPDFAARTLTVRIAV